MRLRVIIPWWSKIAGKVVLSRLPFEYKVWQRLGLFRHGRMDVSNYSINVFDSHVQRSKLEGRLSGKTILELGPGDSLATAIIAAAQGARAILVDAGSFVRTDMTAYLDLQRTLVAKGYSPPDVSGCRTVDDILTVSGVQYLTKGLKSLKQIESDSVDLIFSQAVLEHIRYGEFPDTIEQCRRILRRNGVCSHRVDLKDHLGGGLNNLRFSSAIWESEFFARSGFYTNRLRYSQMLRIFEDAGFSVDVTALRRWEETPIARKKLAREYREIPDVDLRISGFDVLLR